jgi:hypothetical protein
LLTKTNQVEEFIKDYQRSRVVAIASVRAALNRALEFEKKFQKVFYEFSEDEVIEMYKTINAISARSLQNINLILKHAAKWLLHKNGKSVVNIYDDITKDILQQCVNMSKKDGLILTKDQLENIQNDLLNDTDKTILEALFIGIGSKWLKELTFFDMSQIDRQDGLIYFRTGKTIHITEEQYELFKRACDENELISFGQTMRISRVKSHGIFKERFNSLSASDDPTDVTCLERRFRFIQRRLLLMSKDFDVQLTSGNLQASGLLYNLQQGVINNDLTFREYVKTEEAKVLARRYDILSEFAPQILLEKFEKYFQ